MLQTFALLLPSERATVRELVRARVLFEVEAYNANSAEPFRGLVQPTGAERVIDGFKLPKNHKIDAAEQVERALEAFERNGFLVLVGDRQAENLDEVVLIGLGTEVSFVKLVPLVGG